MAVAGEDYATALRLADASRALQDEDAVGALMRDLGSAVADERYVPSSRCSAVFEHSQLVRMLRSYVDAAALRDAGAGLVGWWHGVHEPADGCTYGDPHGCILHITPAHGRFLGRVHTPGHLADVHSRSPVPGSSKEAGAGLLCIPPSLELFARRQPSAAAPMRYVTRAVVTCLADGESAFGLSGSLAPATDNFDSSPLRCADATASTRHSLAKFQHLDTPLAGVSVEDAEAALFTAFSSASAQPLPPPILEAADGINQFKPAKLAPLQRVPASLLRLGLHQFLLQYLTEPQRERPPRRHVADRGTSGLDHVTRSAVAAKWGSVADGVSKADAPSQQSRAFLASEVDAATERASASRSMLLDGAASSMRAGRTTRVTAASSPHAFALPPAPHLHTTRFTRIDPRVASGSGANPLSGLYLGAFGPHGPEVLQLAHGRWGDSEGGDEDCVTAIKLTGDRNVPAGFASFRARVGRAARLENHGAYPEELGVLARYKGQGRAAKPGFADPRWVDGELLLLDGKGGSLTGGAELGLVWAVPGERRFLILLSRLQLPA